MEPGKKTTIRNIGDGGFEQRFSERMATALFADLVGSTSIGEKLSPREFALLISDVDKIFKEEFDKRGGDYEKPIGDASYGFYNATNVHENPEAKAIDTGMAALERIGDLKEIYSSHGISVDYRIGIHTGQVIATKTTVGSSSRGAYTILGDGVNTAKRTEEAGIPGKVVVTEDVYKKVSHMYEWEELVIDLDGNLIGIRTEQGVIELDSKKKPKGIVPELSGVLSNNYLAEGKGKSGKLKLHVVRKKRLDVRAVRKLRETDFVGRKKELDRFAELRKNLPYFSFIEEDAGFGKSRFVRKSREKSNLVFADIGFDPVEKVPYGGLRDYFERKPVDKDAFTEELRFLGPIIDSEYALDENSVLEESRFRALHELFAKLDVDVLTLEDIHNADAESLKFIEWLYNYSGRKISVEITSRPHGLKLYGEQVKFEKLQTEEIKLILSDVLQDRVSDIPAEKLAEEILIANGNPLIAEQRAANYLDTGMWVASPELRSIISARKDSLNRGERMAMEYVAVLGTWKREFSLDVLGKIAEAEFDIGTLERLGWVSLLKGDIYQINHHSYQEIVYSELGEQLKLKYHTRAAEISEKFHLSPDSIAHHYERSAKPLNSVPYREKLAGSLKTFSERMEQAKKAVTALESEINILKDSKDPLKKEKIKAVQERVVNNKFTIAGRLLDMGRYLEAQKVLEDVKEPIQTLSLSSQKLETLEEAITGWSLTEGGEYKQAIRKFKSAHQKAQEIGDKRLEALSLYNMAHSFFEWSKKHKEKKSRRLNEISLRLLEESKPLIEQYAPHMSAALVNEEGVNLMAIGEIDERKYTEAIEKFEKYLIITNGNRPLQSKAHNNLGNIQQRLKNYQEAEAHFLKGLELAKDFSPAEEIRGYNNIGRLYLEIRREEEAKTYLQKGLQLASNFGNPQLLATEIEEALSGVN